MGTNSRRLPGGVGLAAAARADAAASGIAGLAMGKHRHCRPQFGRRPIAGLSEKERVILQWASEGKTNRQIAGLIHRSEATIKGHIETILDKLDCPCRTSAVAKAIREGYIQ